MYRRQQGHQASFQGETGTTRASSSKKEDVMGSVVGLVLGTRAATAAVVFLVTWRMLDFSLFSYHPVCMTLGYALMMSEAVRAAIFFRGTAGEDRVRKITKHMGLNLLALALVTIGFIAVYKNKVRLGKEHYQSNHGKVGLAAFVSTFVVVAGGILSFKKLGIIEVVPENLHGLVKRVHRAGGMVAFLLALAAMQLGLLTGALNPVPAERVAQFAVAAIALSTLYFWYTWSDNGAYAKLDRDGKEQVTVVSHLVPRRN